MPRQKVENAMGLQRPDFLMRLQRGFVTVLVITAILWFVKGREANLQQKSFLIAAACFAVVGVTVIAVIRTMRNR